MKPDTIEEVLSRPLVATVAAIRQDGPPYQAPVWFLWRDGVFWLTGTRVRTWCKLLTRHPAASLCIDTAAVVAGYVAVDCRAERVEEDIWPVSIALARKYVGGRAGATDADVERFVANMRTEPRILFRLTPERWRAIDLTVYTGMRGDREWQGAGRDS
jgi:nitroimidazol reductase NimA-like FMN-containing flavoprotein (pyridoxamine 5'-phosphate oxidase superfamily)